MLRMLTAIGLVAFCGTALGAEVIDSRFEVVVTQDGVEQSYPDTSVPYLPDASCYYWFVRFDPTTTGEVTLAETLSLPEPLAAWKDYKNDPSAQTQINPDAQSALTTLKATPDDGWVSHGWCVAEGDPLGAHTFSVSMDGKEIARWDFSVVAPEDFAFAAPETGPAQPPALYEPTNTARDVNQSW
jgi:hypothetical protein